MKALVKPRGVTGLRYVDDAPVPVIGPRDVLIKVQAASICGSDIHIYDDDPVFRDRIEDCMVVGHEFCGEVVKLGAQVTDVALGDIVAAESHVVCGTCFYCRNGMSNVCQEISGIGFDRAGGFAEYIAIPAENAVLKPSSLPVDVGAFLEPFGNALDTALCVDLVGKTVLVTGLGPQGLMALAIAKAAGARRIIATEVSPERRALGEKVLAAHSDARRVAEDAVLDAGQPNLVEEIFNVTGGLGVDVVLEMSGHPAAITDACIVLRNRGDLVALGLPSGPVEFDWGNQLVLKGATFHGIYGRHLYETWTKARDLLESRAVRLEMLITHRFPLEQYETAFQLLKAGKGAKVILYPDMTYAR